MLYFVLFLVLLVGVKLSNSSFRSDGPQKLRTHLYALGMVLVLFSLGTMLMLVIESFK